MDLTTYSRAWDHYQDELALLSMRTRRLMSNFAQAERQDDPFDSFKGIVISEQEILQILDASPADQELSPEIRRLWKQELASRSRISDKIRLSLEQGAELPLVELARLYQLDELETQCLMLAFAIELDRKYEKLYAYLQDDVTCKHPTVDLALRFFCRDAGERFEATSLFTEDGKLFRTFLVREMSSDYARSGLSRILKLDDRIVAYLKGYKQVDEKISAFATLQHPSEAQLQALPLAAQQDDLQAFLRFSRQQDRTRTVLVKVWGPTGSGKKHYVKQFGIAEQKSVLMARVSTMVQNEPMWPELIDRLIREATLQEAAICFDDADVLFHEEAKFRFMLDYLVQRMAECGAVHFLILKSNQAIGSSSRLYAADWEIPVPDVNARLDIWQQVLQRDDLRTDVELRPIASKFQFTVGRIIGSTEMAKQLLLQKGDSLLTAPLLNEACYHQTRHKLSELTVKIKPQYSWNELILAPAQKELLYDACNQYKFRELVYGEWGFGGKLSYGKGISMLFAGPPGTGKTMTAQVIANDLGLELYKIDLSQIVSKYIGETEKNLHQIFSQARLTSAILFFDEADSLFGKRSEINNAHDKYANIETAYLLQKMEEYDGVTILATNFAQNLDDAFNRRINYIVRFPFPDASHREQIWRRFFPANAPVQNDLDFAYLAETFEVAGGIIKNIVVAAAFLAARDGTPIGMKHLVTALTQEYAKLGKLIAREQVEPFIHFRG
ncbi:AAA family ATPase [Paenibacillus koleovorans]|uniref:AAA family ATPase n=1 Tax=Paenibacillus koleovorans TaxID=121608 RepID=UPI000FD9F5DF|nr:AAA family ATPase [Paenibacillus koleovorans]